MTFQDFIHWLYRNERFRRRALPAIWLCILFWIGVYAVFVPLWVNTAVEEAITNAIYPYLPFPLFQQYWAFQYRFPETAFALLIDVAVLPLTALFLTLITAPTFRQILRDQQGESPGRDELLRASMIFLGVSVVLALLLLYGHRITHKSLLFMLWPERAIYVFVFTITASLALSGFAALITTVKPKPKPQISPTTKWRLLHRYEGSAVTGLIRLVQTNAADRRFQLARFDPRNAHDLQLWLANDLQTPGDPVPDQFLGFIDKDQSQQDIAVKAGINLAAYRYVTIRQEGQTQPLAYAGL